MALTDMLWKLVNRRAVPCDDIVEWGRAYSSMDRRVAETWLDDVRVSTVFLAVDYNPIGRGDPVLFETMVFVAGKTHHMRRYSLWEEAESGHAEMVELIRSEMRAARVKAAEAWTAVSERFGRQ